MYGSPNEQPMEKTDISQPLPSALLSQPTCKYKTYRDQKNPNLKTTMSTGHQMLTYAICTQQQRTKIIIILVQRIKRGERDDPGVLVCVGWVRWERGNAAASSSCRSVAENVKSAQTCLSDACAFQVWVEVVLSLVYTRGGALHLAKMAGHGV